ncbi:hypothetical protein BHYA_0004g01380 [Botrytis hyacinthi]|uniref:Uncharacterized protein n=1 Tax=Botrytis hyacinthi TaxID=278943 RepID=A0A4Z1H504_9HELO|nr:hypothetical protein BHYA_0004g01380 [Botrytis hyacinthi]
MTSGLWLLIAVENMTYAMLELHGATGGAELFYVTAKDLNIVVVLTEQPRNPACRTPQSIEEPSGNLKLAVWGLQMR